MAQSARFILLPIIRASPLTSTTNPSFLSRSRTIFCGYSPLAVKSWVKGLEQGVRNHVRNPNWRLLSRRFEASNFCKQGRKLGLDIVGTSVVIGSWCLVPGTAYAINGIDMFGEESHMHLSSASAADKRRQLLAFVKKLLVPVFLIVTVFANWGHPVMLITKMILILFGTKPSPLSVYLFIDELRRQIIDHQPLYYKFKSLYAKKVEVDDYVFLCLARVEIKDQKLSLVGVLGSWWVLPSSELQSASSRFGSNFMQNYINI